MDQGEYQMEAETMGIARKNDKKVNSVMLLRSVAIRLRDNLKLMSHNSIRRRINRIIPIIILIFQALAVIKAI